MRANSFWRERLLAFCLGIGIVLIVFGVAVIGQTPQVGRGLGWRFLQTGTEFGLYLVYFGAGMSLLSIVFGLAIAFGVGPNALATKLPRTVVEDKFETLADGTPLSSTVGSEAWNSRDLKSRPH